MLARLSGLPSDLGNWSCEYMWEGIRTICYWDGHTLSLQTRNGRNITGICPEFRDLPRAVGPGPIILDGQVVGLDRKGALSLSLLERRMHSSADEAKNLFRKMPLRFFVSDILFQGERWLTAEPYLERRQVLEELHPEHDFMRISPAYQGEAKSMLEIARQHGLPGIICKRLDSVYEPGMRSPNWRKVKIFREQEFVIGGWMPSRDSEEAVGSLLLGYHTPQGELVYAGEASSGLHEANRDILRERLKRCSAKESPFTGKLPRKRAFYLCPRLVAQVRFEGWTDGRIREAVYRGLKLDKDAADVFREEEE
jgi:bifunctional non-homologous end joining protein LigD